MYSSKSWLKSEATTTACLLCVGNRHITRRTMFVDACVASDRGLDICHTCDVSWYNRAVGEELALPFENQLAVLIGNSRALWQPMISHYRCASTLPLHVGH